MRRSEPSFEEMVLSESGVDFRKCIACGACSSGCPYADLLDYKPHQIAQMIRLGMKGEVLFSRAVRLCSACFICQERCQKGVELTELMIYLHRLRVREEGASGRVKALIDSIRRYGRVSELRLALSSWGLTGGLRRALLGLRLLRRKGKSALRVEPVEDVGSVAKLVEVLRGGEA